MATDKHLQLEIDRLKYENAKLRKALKVNGRHARRLQRAYDTALLLATWHVAHLPVSRAFARSHGVGQRSWENAIALLRLARVVHRQTWRMHDIATIERALARAQERANAAPEVYFLHVAKHGRP